MVCHKLCKIVCFLQWRLLYIDLCLKLSLSFEKYHTQISIRGFTKLKYEISNKVNEVSLNFINVNTCLTKNKSSNNLKFRMSFALTVNQS